MFAHTQTHTKSYPHFCSDSNVPVWNSYKVPLSLEKDQTRGVKQRHRAQNWPGKYPNPAHWMTLENAKEDMNFELLIEFSQALQLNLLIKTLPLAIYTR